jgi:hypothetical protein
MYALLIHEKKLKSIVLFNTFLLIPLKGKLQLKQGFKLFKRTQYYIQSILGFFY